MEQPLWSHDATTLADLIRTRQLSSVELLRTFLARIEQLDGDIGAVVTTDLRRAESECAAADAALLNGDALGPLHGLPVTVKDAIATGGLRSTGGAIELREHVPSDDAPAVAKLRAAGAIVFGKTNLPRWSADAQTYNEIFGTTSNPWDLSRTPGGSSGGAAAAVATGFTSFELGTDIGGSIRIPSHFCGVFGLKPSFGVVPQRGYLDHVGGGTTDADINVFGPIARSAEDLELLLAVLAGPVEDEAAAWRLRLPPPRVRRLTRARVAIWLDDEACPIDDEYHALLRATAAAIEGAGAHVELARPPVDMRAQVDVFMAMVSAAVAPSMPADAAEAAAGSHLRWLELAEQRAQLRRTWAEWFRDWDVLLCPVAPTAAFPHDQQGSLVERRLTINGEDRPYFDCIAWTGLIGIVGLPSAVVPIGTTSAGLPVGAQVVAPYLHDRTAVRVAALISHLGPGYTPPPSAMPPANA